MATKLFLSLLFFFAATSSVADAGESADVSGGANFILTSCNATLYPHLCYTSLSRYAETVQQRPGQLACAAITVSLTKAQHAASYVSNLTRQADHDGDSRAAVALRHCFSNLDDAVDEIRDSLQQMRRVEIAGSAGTGTDSFLFQMSNVKTWMSAALTGAETCTDGFRLVPDGPVKAEVCRRVAKVKKLTSNALALVNSYANK